MIIIYKYLSRKSCDYRTVFVFLLILVIFFYNSGFLTQIDDDSSKIKTDCSIRDSYELDSHYTAIQKYYEKRKEWKTSNLGAILFKNVDKSIFIHASRTNKTYSVLIWKYWDWLKKRHIYNFDSSKRSINILEGCSVTNCRFSGDNEDLGSADAVVIHMQRGVTPSTRFRKPSQRWIFLSDESPLNTFSLATSPVNFSQISNLFNWTMTYRSDSDIPVPYGRTVPLEEPIIIESNNPETELNNLVVDWNKKQFKVLAMALISNCSVKKRLNFIKMLQKFIPVDIFGGCSDVKENKNKCPGHFRADCKVAKKYLFYLVLENSNNCHQYLTEKGFYHAYAKGAIPIIMGTSINDCRDLLPPDSFIHVDEYKTVKELTDHIKDVSNSYEKLLSYHLWRKNFEVINEHGYFGTRSYHYCRICEALNYNDGEEKSYETDDLREFFDKKIACDANLKHDEVKENQTHQVTKMKNLDFNPNPNTTKTKETTVKPKAAIQSDVINFREMKVLV